MAGERNDTDLVSEKYLDWCLVNGMWAHSAAEDAKVAELLREKAGQLWAKASDRYGDSSAAIATYVRDVLVPELEKRAKDYRAKQTEHEKRRPPEREEPPAAQSA